MSLFGCSVQGMLHEGSLVMPFKQQHIISDHISATLAGFLFPQVLHFCVLISLHGFCWLIRSEQPHVSF